MNKRIYIIAIIVIVIVGVVCGIALGNKKEEKSKMNNEELNDIQNEQTNVMINEILNNTIEEMNEVSNIATEESSTEKLTESPKTGEEKAIEIAKKDYGDVSNINFVIDGMTIDGKYIVAVRNSTTTEALAYYYVNVADGTFTKE